ncbi:MAG: hypothetical protein Q7S40_13175 [Opitutaceae bacterium]|nr:hypothetical protein [Opitutaceae bacterium]
MKTFHTLKASWLLAAMILVAVVGEFIAWHVTQFFHWRFPAVAIAAVCVGLVAAVVAEFYDGRD